MLNGPPVAITSAINTWKCLLRLFLINVNFKGTGTRDYNWLKVVWYDGSRLGESSADIRKIFLTVPLILY
jgi:hypothetical protein